MRSVIQLVLMLLVAAAGFAGTPGTFRGIVYHGSTARPGWVYVVGKNNSMRLVEVAHATIIYAEDFTGPDRQADAVREFKPGAEVRVTAEQDAHGNWRATEIEIINPAKKVRSPNRRIN